MKTSYVFFFISDDIEISYIFFVDIIKISHAFLRYNKDFINYYFTILLRYHRPFLPDDSDIIICLFYNIMEMIYHIFLRYH